jgi:Rrf2 family protein
MPLLTVSARTEYSVRALVELARSHPAPVTARALADRADLPPRFLSGLLTELARAGVVVGRRGSDHGGYRLTADPSTVDLRTVVVAVEGAVGWLPAAPDDAPWRPIEDAVSDLLAATTLADLARAQPCQGTGASASSP